jgi:phage-related protein
VAKLTTAYVELIPSMQGSESIIAQALVPSASAAGDAAGQAAGGRFGGKFTAALAGGAVVVGGLVAAATGLYQVGAIFDDVSDTIRAGTGATGEALAALEADAAAVATTVPASFEAAASVIADLNTRMGLTGETAQTVGAQYLEAGRILGETVDVNTTTAAFNAFGIAGEDVSGALDSLFQVSQATGVGMNELASSAQAQAPALQALGFTYEDTIALVGGLDQAGLNSTAVMSSMSRGLVTLARDGEEPQAAFQRITGEIEALVGAGDQAAAIDLAAGIFGTRGATQFVGAVESGTVALGDLMGGLNATDDTILGVGRDTMDFAEAWTLVKNQALAFLEPIGSLVFSGLGQAMLAVSDGLGQLPAFFEPIMPLLLAVGSAFTSAFGGVGESFGPLIPQFLELAASVSPLTIVLQALAPSLPMLAGLLGELAATVGGALGQALAVVMPLLTQVAGIVAGALGQALGIVIPIIVELVGVLGPILGTVLEALMPVLGLVAGFLGQVFTAVSPLITAVLALAEPLLGLLAPVLQLVGALLTPLIGLLLAIVTPVLDLAIGLIEWLMPGIMLVVGGITALVGWLVEGITWFVNLVTGAEDAGADLEAFLGGFEGMVGDFFAGIGGWLVDSGEALIQGFIDGIMGMVDAVGDAVGGVMDFVGDFFPNSPAKRGPLSGSGWTAIGKSMGAIEAQFASGATGRIDDVIRRAVAVPSPQVTLRGEGLGIDGVAGAGGGPLVEQHWTVPEGLSAGEIAELSAQTTSFALRRL